MIGLPRAFMRRDDWGDEATPVTDIADPKRSRTEAELQIARVTARDLQVERNELLYTIHVLKTQIHALEVANQQLRNSLRRKGKDT